MALHVVVLAGGSGSRLWPLSRVAVPKHLLPLGPQGQSLLRATVERVLPLGAQSVQVVTAAAQAAACAAELHGLLPESDAVIAEPAARGTGPALGLAVRWIARQDPDAVICSVHADHAVADADAYRCALLAAAGWASVTGGLVTVGLQPGYAATGFGYVGLGDRLDPDLWRPPGDGVAGAGAAGEVRGLPAHTAAGFVEKPPPAEAQRLLDGGRHLWNTGLFAWPAAVFERELAGADAAVSAGVAATAEALAVGDAESALAHYGALPTTAVEPLLLERGAPLTVVRADFAWSDLGSWSDLSAARAAAGGVDAAGNVLDGDVLAVDAHNCLVEARGGRTVAVVGASGLAVVDVGDALLVVPLERAQAVREVVDRLRAEGRTELL